MNSPRNVRNVLERLRADTRASLARHRNRRREVARTIRHTLQQHRAAVVGSVQAALRPIVQRAGVWELWPTADADRRVSRASELQTQVLNVIHAHRDGVRAIEIGNELGVDWRAIVSAARSLEDAGLVERVDQEFYPSGKVSDRW